MALTDERLAALVSYCRLDDLSDEDTALLEAFYSAAVDYMTDAGVMPPKEGTGRAAKYDLCVNCMVLDSWNNREMVQSGSFADNPAFRRVLNQLKLTEVVPDSGTTS